MIFKYQGEIGILIPIFGLYIWILSKLGDFNTLEIDVLVIVFIFIGVILLILWDGTS